MNKTDTMKRAWRIINAAANSTKNRDVGRRLEEIELHEGYAERGYTDPDCGVIATGNWNDISHYDEDLGKHVTDDDTMPRVCALFEELGIEIEWSDEWMACYKCGKIFRTQGDSYGWTASYYELNGDWLCHECVNPADVLEDLEGKPHAALTIDTVDPEEHGYVKANNERYENGWYGGQNDDPKAIAKNLEEHGITRYLFVIDSVRQFDLSFSVYVHEDEAERLQGEPKGKCRVDPATALSSGLKAASKAMGELDGDGIKHATVNSDGTASARLVSPAEFVEGIK